METAEQYGRAILERWLHLHKAGRYSVPLLRENASDIDKETYRAALRTIEAEFGPRRLRGDPITQRHKDIAAGLQAAVQAAQLHLLSHFREATGLDRLCLAGGVALNCVINGAVRRSRIFSQMFVQPAAGDDGAAMGAAIYASRTRGTVPHVTRGSSFGSAYNDARFAEALHDCLPAEADRFEDHKSLCDKVAEEIAGGAVYRLVSRTHGVWSPRPRQSQYPW